MARATFVKKARKDVPGTDIKAGDSYYWWKFRFGGKHYSKTAPKPSQLTQSEFWGTVYGIQEDLPGSVEADDLESTIDDFKSQLEDLKSELEDKHSNMPDSLQYAPTGELLQERIDALDSAISDIDSIDYDIPEKDDDEDDDEYETRKSEFANAALEELRNAVESISCS